MATVSYEVSTTKSKTMSAGRWLALMLGFVGFLAVVSCAVAWALDPFGVLRNPRGRLLRASEDERQAKYLLNEWYVPANFDALIIGASGSLNWKSDLLTGYRFYNESTYGGDATEERLMVEEALKRGHFKVAFVCFHPLITAKHKLQDGLENVSSSEALGSVISVRLTYEMLHDLLRPKQAYYQPDGGHAMPKLPPLKDDPKGTLAMPTVDSQAVADYQALVRELEAHGVRVIYVEYPLHEPHYEIVRQGTEEYTKWLLSVMPPAPFINFQDAAHEAFRKDDSNFIDEAHLTPKGAAIICRELNQRMHAILHDR